MRTVSSRAGGIVFVALLLSVGVGGHLVRPATAQPAQISRVQIFVDGSPPSGFGVSLDKPITLRVLQTPT